MKEAKSHMLPIRIAVACGLVCAAVCGSFHPAHADNRRPAAEASPAPSAEEEAFLSLPAFDLERVDGVAKLQVGDSVLLRISGLSGLGAPTGVKEPDKELQLRPAPGGDNLTDQGWELNIEDSAPVPPGELRVRVTPLKAGTITLPSLAIVRRAEPDGTGASGSADEASATTGPALARTNPLTLTVESAIKADDPKPDQPADLRPPVSLQFPWWLFVLLGAAALALGVGGYLAYRRWRARVPKAEPAKPVAPPRPEDEIALAALAELEKNGPLRRGEFKAHYFRVSEILKAYIGARYRFDASESTTAEMIAHLEERRAMEDARLDRLETLFDKLDLVKFTDHVPLPDEGQNITETAREFVKATRRPPEIMPAAGSGNGGKGQGLTMGGTMR